MCLNLEIRLACENNALEAACDILDALPCFKWRPQEEGNKHAAEIPPI